MNHIEFIQLCDQHEAPPLSIEKCLSYNEIQEIISRKLGKTRSALLGKFALIRKRLAIEKVKRSTFSSTYINTLNTISDALRNTTDYQDVEITPDAWQEVLRLISESRLALHYFTTTGENYSEIDLEFAEAYIGLTITGIEFEEHKNEIFISDKSLERIYEIIDQYCSSIGGHNLLQWVFKLLAPGYDEATGRLLQLTKIKINGKIKVADEAYGYLIALGAKYLTTKGNKNIENAEIQIAIFCRDLTTILEVQDYSIWQTIYYPKELFIRGLQRIVWHDNIVDFKQMKAEHARKILNFFCESFKPKKLTIHGVTTAHICKIAKALIQLSNNKSPTTVAIERIARKANIPLHIAAKAMESTFSFQPRDINTELSFPLKSVSVNYNFRPAVSIAGDYLLYPRPITAGAALNAAINGMVHPNGIRIDEHSRFFGLVLEDFLRHEFLQLGAKIAYGTQYSKKIVPEFESDLIIETGETVIILETKKKDLTRKAMSGNEISLLTDLADSLIHSQAQASRIEFELKKRPELNLIHEGIERKISLNGRTIYKISVTLNDFGAFQDKAILGRTLTHACLTRLAHPDAAEDAQLAKWRKYTDRLKKFNLDNLPENTPAITAFHRSYFMSVPQLLTIIEKSTTANDFQNTLSLVGTMIYGKRNFYREWPQFNKLRTMDSAHTMPPSE